MVDRILFESHRGDLGQELVDQRGVDQEPQPGRWVVDDQQLVELVADALGRNDLESLTHVCHRVDERRVGLQAVAGQETCRPQHAQRIVREALLGRQRRAQPADREIGGTGERIDQLGLGTATVPSR